MNAEPNNTGAIVWINDALEEHAPPEFNVLGVSVIEDGLALTIATYTENSKSCTYTTLAEVVVDLQTFLKGLLATTDKEKALWLAQWPLRFTTEPASTTGSGDGNEPERPMKQQAEATE